MSRYPLSPALSKKSVVEPPLSAEKEELETDMFDTEEERIYNESKIQRYMPLSNIKMYEIENNRHHKIDSPPSFEDQFIECLCPFDMECLEQEHRLDSPHYTLHTEAFILKDM